MIAALEDLHKRMSLSAARSRRLGRMIDEVEENVNSVVTQTHLQDCLEAVRTVRFPRQHHHQLGFETSRVVPFGSQLEPSQPCRLVADHGI